MGEVGIELGHDSPQKLTDALASKVALLIPMGCGEACPVVPGLRRLDWPLEDPKGKPIARVREIRDDVRQRVLKLLEHSTGAPRTSFAPAARSHPTYRKHGRTPVPSAAAARAAADLEIARGGARAMELVPP
jgi:hypothetical protein